LGGDGSWIWDGRGIVKSFDALSFCSSFFPCLFVVAEQRDRGPIDLFHGAKGCVKRGRWWAFPKKVPDGFFALADLYELRELGEYTGLRLSRYLFDM
jgi:hypothetical protein